MKKLISILLYVFIFLCIVTVSGAYAQKVNLIGGMSLSKYHFTGTTQEGSSSSELIFSYTTGFIGGLGIEFKVIKSLTFELDCLYFQKGNKLKHGLATYTDSRNVLSIPALIKFAFLPGSLPYILAGNEFSILLSSKANGIKLTEYSIKYDYGIVFGLGSNFKISRALFFVEVRYHFGLKNIEFYPSELSKTRTRALGIIIGIKI